MEPNTAEETIRLAAALESAPSTDEAISFEGMMAVVEGRDPISQLMESSRKLDRHGLLDRIEGLGWRLYGITERARRTAAASPSGLEPVTGQSELQPGDVVYVEAVISAEMTLSGERPNGYRIGNHSWHRLDRGQRVFRLAALRTTKEEK